MTTLTADMGGGAALTANMGKGSSLTAAVGGGSSLTAILGSGAVSTGTSAEYLAVYNAMTTKPDAATAAIWNTCVETWVANGEWATKDVIYVYAAHTNGAGEALINWKNPGTYNATAYNAPTFTANQGFLGNGTTQYIDCNWVPSVSGVNFVQNSASQIIYVRTNVAANKGHGTALNLDTKDCWLYPKHAGGSAYITTNDATAVSAVNADGSGMFVNTRTASNVKKLYRNKLEIVSGVTVSTGVPTHSPYCLAANDDNSPTAYRADQVSLYAWGAGMTQTHVDNFCDPFNAAMTALGTNVY